MIKLSFDNANCRIWYWYRAGHGKKYVILLHGAACCDHTMFEKQIGIFDASYNVIVWDARGHGLSRLDAAQKFEFKDMFDDCLKLFEIHQIEKAILIGQSMGGNLAQEVAYHHPEIVEKLVLIDCTKNTQKLTSLEKAAIKMSPVIFKCYPWKTLVRQTADACGNSEYAQEYARQRLEKMEKQQLTDIMASLLTCLREDNNYRFKQPVLLICGADDKTGNIKKIMSRWPKEDSGCQLRIIEGAGHNSNQDKPEEVNKIIIAFLNNEEINYYQEII